MAAPTNVQSISVECLFEPDGRIQVRRVGLDGHWQSVGQGRQWVDQDGRHILVMLANNQTGELLLRAGALTWEFRRRRPAFPEIRA